MTKKCFNQIKEGLEELRENIPAIVDETLRSQQTTKDSFKKVEEAKQDGEWMVHASSKSVTIRGITYPSLTVAASALGVSVSSISIAIRRGTEDTIGLGLRQQKDLECDGVVYTNVRELAQAIGHTPASVYLALSRKTKDADGYILLKNHRIKRLAKSTALQESGK